MLESILQNFTPLYEDNHILVALKPPNISTQGDRSGDLSFYDIIKDYIKIKYEKKGNVFLGIVHRLDRPVSGVMVFAKTSKAAGRLSESIREGKFEKTYYAIVNGILFDKEQNLENYIIKQTNELVNIASIVFNDTPGAKLAKLSYIVVEENIIKNMSLVKIRLETGRFHQIRAQFANIGHAIYGDRKYGSYINYEREDIPLALFAKSLKFPHPTKDDIIYVESPLPTKYPWNIFKSI